MSWLATKSVGLVARLFATTGSAACSGAVKAIGRFVSKFPSGSTVHQ